MTNSSLNFAALEKLARRDPAGRGLSGFQWQGELLAHGQLATAASSLVGATGAVAIVTGFAVHDGQAYVPETDGPPGALALADVLEHHRREVVLTSDPLAFPPCRLAARRWASPLPCWRFPSTMSMKHRPRDTPTTLCTAPRALPGRLSSSVAQWAGE
jgi:hypothetical protein